MIVMLQSLQVSRLSQRIQQLTGGVEEGDLESVLGQHLETVRQVGRDLDEVTARTAILESAARHHFSREGLVRFNPFPDAGGNQSFALALLDESDDGVVISSLHSRTGTRIYAKAIVAGKADTSLSAEEQEAIDEARSKRPPRPAAQPRSAAAGRPAQGAAAPAAPPTPAPARKPAPDAAPPANTPAPAVPGARPAPRVNGGPAANPAQASETTQRQVNDRVKGQEKPKNLSSPEVTATVDDERVDRKPGMPPLSRPGQR
jgi:hypothetical protein